MDGVMVTDVAIRLFYASQHSAVTLCRQDGQTYKYLVSNFLKISCTKSVVILQMTENILQIYCRGNSKLDLLITNPTH